MTTAAGETIPARAAVVAVPLNTLGAIRSSRACRRSSRRRSRYGQASRGIKIFIRARGEPATQNAIQPGHEFGYLATEWRLRRRHADADRLRPRRGRHRRRDLARRAGGDGHHPARLEVLDATAHDWLGDPYARGTWAIHRPGWYTRFHAEMRRPEGRVVLAGSDLANGWAGFMDGAIESGLTQLRARRCGRCERPRRAAIVEATLRVIGARGADAVTHRAVAAEAGVPLASTTYYFASKEALVREAFELTIERSLALVDGHAARTARHRDRPARGAGRRAAARTPTRRWRPSSS